MPGGTTPTRDGAQPKHGAADNAAALPHRRLPTVGHADRRILGNASSLFGTTAVTTGLGVVFWAVAARSFPAHAVGFASAAIAAMTLIATLASLGLGTMLMGELPRRPEHSRQLIGGALAVAVTASAILGITYAALASFISPDLRPLGASVRGAALFAIGVAVTAVGLVADQALIGLLRGSIQLARNVVFATSKLVALVVVVVLLSTTSGFLLYGVWVFGGALSLAALAVLTAVGGSPRGRPAAARRSLASGPRGSAPLKGFGAMLLSHQALNLGIGLSGQALPILVVALLSATVNAHFYIAWMVASFAFAVPTALTRVLYAAASGEPEAAARSMRFTLRVSAAVGLLAIAVAIGAGGLILRIFGPAYAEARWTLAILIVAVLPLTVKNHYVAVARLQRKLLRALPLVWLGAVLELALAALGGTTHGLEGLSLGWVVAVCLEAVAMSAPVYRAAS